MKVAKVEAFAIEAPLSEQYWGSQAWSQPPARDDGGPDDRWQGFPPPGRFRPAYSSGICAVIVKISTDDGLVGWGEAKAPVAPRVARTVIQDLLSQFILGSDPRDVVRLWEEMYASMRLRDHSRGFLLEAISGIDIALWDLAAKSLAVPIYRLLGGAFRRHVKIYASAVPGLAEGANSKQWSQVADRARSFQSRGFDALKIALGHGIVGDVQTVRTVRDVVGDAFTLYVDCAERYTVSQAAELAHELEAYRVGFLEAPLPAEDVEAYAELAGKTRICLANDLICNRFEVRDFLVRRALGLVQPDVCRAGGLTECHRIAQLADVFGVAFQPHVSIGSAIHFAASLQLAASVPNLLRMEFWAGENPLGNRTLRNGTIEVRDGMVEVPQGPGLGIEVDESSLLAYVID